VAYFKLFSWDYYVDIEEPMKNLGYDSR